MKNRILITVLLGTMVVAGWHTQLNMDQTRAMDINTYMEKAEKCRSLALYEEAAEHYEEALSVIPKQDTMNQILEVRELFYEEEISEEARAALLASLKQARQLYPEELSYWEREIGMYLENEDYDTALSVCKEAFSHDLSSDLLLQYRDQIKYSYKEDTRYAERYYDVVNGYFLVDSAENHWKWISEDMESESKVEYALIGSVGENNIYASQTLDGNCFFYDTSYVKRGVIKGKPDKFGLYAEGYCPITYGDRYALVDLYGETLADGLDYASSFQNGYACISRGEGKWSVINTDGEETELPVSWVVCDEAGRYTCQGKVLAAVGDCYYIYNSDLSEKTDSFSCADVDVLTDDGWFAFQDKNGKWGFADMEGEVVIEPQYESAKSFSHGVAAVCIGGKWGYINRKAQMVVDAQFLSCGYASAKGICYVQDETTYYRAIVFRYPELL